MDTEQLEHFQTHGETWKKRAGKQKPPTVIDPDTLKVIENLCIRTLQKVAQGFRNLFIHL